MKRSNLLPGRWAGEGNLGINGNDWVETAWSHIPNILRTSMEWDRQRECQDVGLCKKGMLELQAGQVLEQHV
jgi:hypothetical protein